MYHPIFAPFESLIKELQHIVFYIAKSAIQSLRFSIRPLLLSKLHAMEWEMAKFTNYIIYLERDKSAWYDSVSVFEDYECELDRQDYEINKLKYENQNKSEAITELMKEIISLKTTVYGKNKRNDIENGSTYTSYAWYVLHKYNICDVNVNGIHGDA